jgi:hypothetical protein
MRLRGHSAGDTLAVPGRVAKSDLGGLAVLEVELKSYSR